MPIEVIVSAQFYRAASKLQKRYPNVLQDVGGLKARLEAGELPGDRVQGLPNRVYKARIPNRDARRGKSGGYRVVYYLKIADQIILISIYTKSDQSDIPTETIRRLIAEYEIQNPPKK